MVDYLMQKFSIDEETAKKMLKSIDLTSIEKLDNRINEFLNYTQMDAKSFAKLIVHTPRVINSTISQISKNQSSYERLYDIDKDLFIKIFKKSPSFVTYTPNYILKKEVLFQNHYGITKNRFRSIILNEPKVLEYSVNRILDVEKIICQKIGYSSSEFAKMVRASSGVVLKFNPQTFEDRFNELNEKFGITKKEFIKMTTIQPNILSGEAVFSRMQSLLDLGIEKDDIAAYAGCLGEPLQNIESKYKFAKILGLSDKTFLGGAYRTSLQKAYARACGLDKNGKIVLSYVYCAETKFNKKAKLYSSDLINDYPLTLEKEREIVEHYNNKKDNDFINLDVENSQLLR